MSTIQRYISLSERRGGGVKKAEKFFIVSEAILPEAIIKSAQAKELLAKGEAETVNQAVEKVGLSRSAYYKYKDGIFPLNEASRGKIVTISLILSHQAGILSKVLNTVARMKGNVLTINQGLPLQGTANVSISIETKDMNDDLEKLLEGLREIEGVKSVQIIGQN
ncbi:MAG: ACT domain-containing protein [Clostridia bacterium]|nr:ACT domain-containing protein [Clostridia bacterium]